MNINSELNLLGINNMKNTRRNRYEDNKATNKQFRFRLKEQEEDFIYKPNERQFTFYQICQFKINNRYLVRKITYNEYGEIIKYKTAKLKRDKLDKFIKKCPEYKYTIYATYDLENIGFPNDLEIHTTQSRILNNY